MSVNSISPPAVLPSGSAIVSNTPTESLDAFRATMDQPDLSALHDRSATALIDPLTEAARGSGVVPTPGDAILSSMEKLSVGFTHAMEAARSTAASTKPGEMHAGDWLRAQIAISALSLECDMLAKVVGKATQSLDAFLKNQ
ncbi:EscI/YscI/HrpB family type III secretion system inner rod protein [Sinorhizobium meliloti]|uniref:EscI/YscI/HrpB family type III secretion system inner rod protein n=1 Tax=Rhizobium meliloti TaxID=382 RepID=UPI002091D678|nr:EscI/YscI/HrpB family type III secretion system inner rod protein [Sinorhizobium meliloti]